MRRITILALVAIAMGACADWEPTAPADARAPLHVHLGQDAIPGSYIVVLRPGADSRKVAEFAGTAMRFRYDVALQGFAAELTDRQLDQVRSHPDVAYVEMDKVVAVAPPCGTPNGGPCPPDGGGGGGSETVPWGVQRVGGGINYTGSNVAWVLDTGIDLDHPDLDVDASRGANFARGSTVDDGNGHGTHVAGTIAAIGGNGLDVVGVAAGATVIPVRVLGNNGSGSYSGVIAGVDHVAANGSNGDVANMSLTGPPSAALDDAVAAAAATGVRFTLAAGNDGSFAGNYSPARVNGSNVYTISATASNDCLTSWSNWGVPPVDYAEPGASILSTRKGGGTTTMSGTSMAAPHAAGLLLLGSIRSGGAACGGDGEAIGIH